MEKNKLTTALMKMAKIGAQALFVDCLEEWQPPVLRARALRCKYCGASSINMDREAYFPHTEDCLAGIAAHLIVRIDEEMS